MTLLLTRPVGQNEELRAFFLEQGIKSFECPVFSIEPKLTLSEKGRREFDEADVFIITSIHALHVLDENHKEKQFYVVGKRTEKKLREAGFFRVKLVSETAEALLAEILKKPEKEKFVFLSGNRVSLDFSEELGKKGYQGVRVMVYDSVPVDMYFEKIAPSVRMGGVSHLLVFSDYTAERVIELFEKHALIDVASAITCFAFSEKIKHKLERLCWKKIFVSPSPQLKMFCSLASEMILKE